MKEQRKRITAMILCLVLLFTAAVQVSASETDADPLIVRADRVYNPGWTEKVVLVLTFNSAYTAVGQTPTVTLTHGNGEIKSVDPQQIRQAVYFMDGVAYPQLFIAENLAKGTVSVGAGAFQTADGTPSPAAQRQYTDLIDFWKFHMFCRSKGVTAGNRLLEGKPVSLSFEPARKDYDGYVADKFLAALWAPYIEYADNGTPVEASFTPQGRGTHTFTARLNDFVSDYIPLEVAARYQTFPDVWKQYGPMQLYGLARGLGMILLTPVLSYLGAGLGIAGLTLFWKCSIGFWHGLFIRGDEAELFCKHQYGDAKDDYLFRSYTSRDEYRYGAYGL